jgi:hypothetical protein
MKDQYCEIELPVIYPKTPVMEVFYPKSTESEPTKPRFVPSEEEPKFPNGREQFFQDYLWKTGKSWQLDVELTTQGFKMKDKLPNIRMNLDIFLNAPRQINFKC